LTTSGIWSSRTIVMVSHDRFFLDQTCTDMLHISGTARRLTQTQCSYCTWARFRAEQQKGYEHRRKVRCDEIAKCKAYIGSGRWARIRKLEREAKQDADELAALQEDAYVPLEILAGGMLDGSAIRLQNVSFAYPGAKPLFNGLGNPPHQFNIDTTSRIVFVGENGKGKTTLLKLLSGRLQPTEGEIVISRHARLAEVNQHHADQIDLAKTPFQFLKDSVPGNGTDAWHKFLREELIENGIDASLVDVPAAALSGGLRSRLALIVVSVMKPHVLFMDEPTNNLDASGVEALADAIEKFKGGVVVVSHDHYFVSRVANEVWAVDGRQVKQCECGFEEYLAKMLCKLDPRSDQAVDAVNAYAAKKRMSPAYLSGGPPSREALARELGRLRGCSA